MPSRSKLVRIILYVCGGGALCLLLTIGLANLWMHRSASGRTHTVDSTPNRDVALVLGAGLQPDGTPSPYLAARLDIGHDLLARGKVKAILVSGDNQKKNYDEPTAMRDYLIKKGTPADRIVTDHAGLDTYDSCYRARDVFGTRSMTVVSQGYHVPRALAVCRALDLDVVGVGDETGRQFEDHWSRGERREVLAAVKAAWDITSHREPILGSRETSLQEAIRRG